MSDTKHSRRPATVSRATFKTIGRAAPIVAAAFAVSGCAQLFGEQRTAYYQPRVGDTPDYATSSIPQSAAVVGASHPVETGIAAWNGDISQPGLTAAHATLPPRSWARITNVSTGRSTTVRISERLAPGAGRAIELSRDAAAAVGALHTGLVTVLIEPLDPRQTTPQDRQWVRAEPIPPKPQSHARSAPSSGIEYDPNLATGSIPTEPLSAAPAQPLSRGLASNIRGSSYVQLGAFKDSKNAHKLLSRIGSEGMTDGDYGDGFIETAYVNGQIWHRVRLGPLDNMVEARRALKDAQSLGHNGARIVRP